MAHASIISISLFAASQFSITARPAQLDLLT
jgi:hypothetical protein